MMNDAMMQKKSIHTNTQQYLMDYVRRALFMLLLVVVSGDAWGALNSSDLESSMFHKWGGPGADAQDNGTVSGVYNLGSSVETVYGDGNVYYLYYADLSNYMTLSADQMLYAPAMGTPAPRRSHHQKVD